MNNSVFNEELLEKSNIIGVHFSVEQMEQFYKYMNLLIEWNEKMNLTAIIITIIICVTLIVLSNNSESNNDKDNKTALQTLKELAI